MPLGTARLVNDGTFNATLKRVDGDQAVFSTADQEQSVALQDLRIWGRPSEPRKGAYVLLADGGMIVGEVTAIAPDHVQIASARRPGLWKASRLPRQQIKAIVYQSSASPPQRERFDFKLLSAADAQDRLLLVSGDSLRGSLLDAATPAEGEAATPTLRFLLPGAKEPLAIGQQRIVAAVLGERAAGQALAAGRFWLAMADGSQVLASGIETIDDSVVVTLASGATLAAAAADNDLEPPESFWSRVALVQPLSPRIDYLSDLKTIGFKHVPLLDWQEDYANDRSVTHSRLRAGGERFIKGIGMPATSRLAYEIPAGAKRFEAEIAIDDDAVRGGSVVFRVFLETMNESWKPAFESEIVRGGDLPRDVRVELGAAQRLALVVEMADRGDQRDWADWLNARFVK
jgi:hypothetical protein